LVGRRLIGRAFRETIKIEIVAGVIGDLVSICCLKAGWVEPVAIAKPLCEL